MHDTAFQEPIIVQILKDQAKQAACQTIEDDTGHVECDDDASKKHLGADSNTKGASEGIYF